MSKMPPTSLLPEHFPLDTLGPVLGLCKVPTGKFTPDAAWIHTYGVYTLTGRGARVGKLELRRTLDVRGGAANHVRYDRSLTGGSQQTAGTIRTRAGDELNQPRQWSFQTRLLDAAGKPLAHTRQSKAGTLADGVVRIKDSAGTTQYKIAGPCAMNWALFDVVQRLDREKTRALSFTLMDHFDQIKPGYVLSYRKTADVAVGKATVRLSAYDQLGRGNVPWVYWVDGHGRLLVVVAGLEAYMLETSEQPPPTT